MESIALISKKWSPQHVVMTDAVQSIDSQEMEYVLKRDGVGSILSRDLELTIF